ncbi:hypothetical protein BN873_990018 [Candidatus Competibacter denitrificans Run_A_D11]|uniref:ProQ/FinO domain-containing protein n=1 Tax=Candidatus Competibacter denitrificans Run_A_D11 TaxID=1400863 RepID=W6MA34_9GAMM|nr:ProQ/FinO family protein [Candidatus Competibacter denitrificans]CDI04547.1 hypothetical protein BN873_990018 [Candidatus Competibacter denitrificans Run_A_D11]
MTDLTPPLEASPVLREPISLTDRFQECFNWNRVRPLKIGIHQDLLAVLGEGFTRAEIKRLLGRYCNHVRYQRSLREGAVRIDLQGQPAGVVTAEEAEVARARLPGRTAPTSQSPHGSASALASSHPSNDTLLPEDHLVPGRLELTVKFSELPKPLPVQSGLKIGIQTGEGIVSAILPSKVWKKLEQAAKDYPHWVAALSGALDQFQTGEITLKHPALQIFEKKSKPPQEPGVSRTDTSPPPSVMPHPPASTPAPADSQSNPPGVQATLSLKGKGQKAS